MAKNDIVIRKVTLTGVNPIMFDAMLGQDRKDIPPEQRFYFGSDGQTLIMPAENIRSMLTSQNSTSACKRFLDVRKYKTVASAILAFTNLKPDFIPIMRDGKPIVFKGPFVDDRDEATGAWVDRRNARLRNGQVNYKVRPILPLPWEVTFMLEYWQNPDVSEELLRSLFVKSGFGISLGTFRPVWGKFQLTCWE